MRPGGAASQRKQWSIPVPNSKIITGHRFEPYDGVIFGVNGGVRTLRGHRTFQDPTTTTTPSTPFAQPLVDGPYGKAWGTSSSTVGCYWYPGRNYRLPGTVTWVWVGRRTGTPSSFAGLVCGRIPNGSGMICNNSGDIASNANDDASRYGFSGIGQPTLNQWVTVQCAFDVSETRWFVGGGGGTQTQTFGFPTTGWLLDSAHRFSISTDSGQSSRFYPGEVMGGFIIPRALSFADMRALDADPFQFLTV